MNLNIWMSHEEYQEGEEPGVYQGESLDELREEILFDWVNELIEEGDETHQGILQAQTVEGLVNFLRSQDCIVHSLYEEIMPVSEFGWEPTESQVLEQVAATQHAAGSDLPVIRVTFLEHDSSNPTHACGYWAVELDGCNPAI